MHREGKGGGGTCGGGVAVDSCGGRYNGGATLGWRHHRKGDVDEAHHCGVQLQGGTPRDDGVDRCTEMLASSLSTMIRGRELLEWVGE